MCVEGDFPLSIKIHNLMLKIQKMQDKSMSKISNSSTFALNFDTA
jgi:hypothetical protein